MSETMTFGTLSIRFDDDVLRPRAWTIAQSQWAVELAGDLPAGPMLELCSGVGHIGLALALRVDRPLLMVDADAHACALARTNAESAGLADRVEVRSSAVEEALEPNERFALILADPPWVRSEGTAEFPEDPENAIDGGADGLDIARSCADVIDRHLAQGGAAIIQLGDEGQVADLDEHLRRQDARIRVHQVRSPDDNGVLALLRER